MTDKTIISCSEYPEDLLIITNMEIIKSVNVLINIKDGDSSPVNILLREDKVAFLISKLQEAQRTWIKK
jgi:hypothetical protein